MTGRFGICVVLTLGLAFLGCGDSPTQPQRFGTPTLFVRCDTLTPVALICRADVECLGGPCTRTTPTDLTSVATWTADHPGIVDIRSPGRIEPVGVGHTVVRATSGRLAGEQTIAVFPGVQPQPTYEISGMVTFVGASPIATRALDGAVIEVLNGPLAGKSATSGSAPVLLPGYSGSVGPGYYRILGVPPGAFRIRITKDGYLPQDREVSASVYGGPVANFDLQPSPAAKDFSPGLLRYASPDRGTVR